MYNLFIVLILLLIFSSTASAELRFKGLKIQKATSISGQSTNDLNTTLDNNFTGNLRFADKDSYEFELSYHRYRSYYPYITRKGNQIMAKSSMGEIAILYKKNLNFLSIAQRQTKLILGSSHIFYENDKVLISSENRQKFTTGLGHYFSNKLLNIKLVGILRVNRAQIFMDKNLLFSALYKMRRISFGGELTLGKDAFYGKYTAPSIVFVHKVNKNTKLILKATRCSSIAEKNKSISAAMVIHY